MTALAIERDEAFAATRRATEVIRLANAIVRDGFLTAAEQSARMNAYFECLDGATP